MKKSLLLLMIALTVTGCTTVQYNGAATKIELISVPEIGVVVSASIGDDLLAKGRMVTENILVVHNAVDGVAFNIPPKSYLQIGHDSEQEFYSSVGVTQNPFADPHQALAVSLISEEEPEICVITVFGGSTCYKASFSKNTQVSREGNSFQQTLIYSGRVGDKINVGYRESSSNFARPAFNNDVEYDLSESNTISYKGAQIEIIEAGNNSITYRVIANFK